MIDIKQLRENPDEVRQKILSRQNGNTRTMLSAALELDKTLRELMSARDSARTEVKRISKEVGQAAAGKSELKKLKATSKKLGENQSQLENEITQKQQELKNLLLQIPNLPSDECPIGRTSEDNQVLEVDATFDPSAFQAHQKIPHWEFATEMGILDMERAVKLSGSMFGMFRGDGAQLSNALIQLALERNRDLYEEIRPPSLVLTETLTSTGHLPKFADDAYYIERDGLWAIPTGEVPLTSLMANETIESHQLPLRFMAYTPCYRREAGSAGAGTRGMLRVHEFDKVEILACATPEQAAEVHQEILDRAVNIVKELGLKYRVVDICTGDLGASSARTFDVEVFAPGSDRWLECSSVSWFTDYQARRANIRYQPESAKKTDFIHTLNGSAIAVPRVWAALVETHRQTDGTIAIPNALQPYMSGKKIIQPPKHRRLKY